MSQKQLTPENIQPMLLPDARLNTERINESIGLIDPLSNSTDSNPGPSVDIVQRSIHLESALGDIAGMSRTAGLQAASQTGFRRGLERRYGNVDAVVGQAAAKQPERLNHAKNEFARGVGHFTVLESGIMTDAEAKDSTRSDFNAFIGKYGDARGSAARDKYRKKLAAQRRIYDKPVK